MKISIITINLNNLEGLKKTYQSIAYQSYQDKEWIVIDGGSTQGDKTFIEQHVQEISYWCSEKDSGVYNALNKGILHATGDYIICMNSGDCFHDKEVLAHVFSTQQNADIIYGDWIRVSENGNIETKYAPKEMNPYFFYYDNICHQAMFVKTSVMKSCLFDENYKIYADWAKWRELYELGCSFMYVPYIICDFETGTGLSERLTDAIYIEKNKLEKDVPEGIKNIREKAIHEALDKQMEIFRIYTSNSLIKPLYTLIRFYRKHIKKETLY